MTNISQNERALHYIVETFDESSFQAVAVQPFDTRLRKKSGVKFFLLCKNTTTRYNVPNFKYIMSISNKRIDHGVLFLHIKFT